MWSAFFLYFFVFSCFSEARKAVKRTPEVKFSYTELALILLLDFIGTVRVTFHAVSAKYFSLPARNISCWKAMIGGQQVTRIGGVPEKIAQGVSRHGFSSRSTSSMPEGLAMTLPSGLTNR